MIRRAMMEDIPAIIAMGQKFHAASGYGEIVPLDEASLARAIADMIDSKTSACFVLLNEGVIVGSAAVFASPIFFNSAHQFAAEQFWWVEPEHRRGSAPLRLMRTLEDWARANNCVALAMLSLESIDPVRVDRIYKSTGFTPVEHTYIKSWASFQP